MSKRFVCFVLCCCLPLLGHAWGLTYRVTNGSSAVVKFNSTDWLDWGTRVSPGQTLYNTYYFPPKNMYVTVYNYDWSRFTISTSTGCDIIGLPPMRQQSSLISQLKGNTVRFSSGTVDITVVDLPGSTQRNRRIGCSLIVSE